MGLDERDVDVESARFFTRAGGSLLETHAAFLSSLNDDIISWYTFNLYWHQLQTIILRIF